MTFFSRLAMVAALAVLLAACSDSATDNAPPGNTEATDAETAMPASDNPFFHESTLPYELPPFGAIEDRHFMPAFERGMAEHLAEVEAIATQEAEPTFENTILALERSGTILNRVARAFFNLNSADTNETREAIQTRVAPMLSAHSDKIMLNDLLFERVETLFEQRNDLGLKPGQVRLIEQYYQDFVLSGALLADEEKARLRDINSRLAGLTTAFSQNVLDEVNASAVVVDDVEKLGGLSEEQIATAAQAAKERGLEGKYVIRLQNTTIQPILASMNNRDLRKRIMTASLSRGSTGGEFDNRKELAKIIKLRAEKAQLLGYDNFAAYQLSDQTAKTPEAVNDMLAKLAPLAVANAKEEAAALQELIDAAGKDFELKTWDWAYFAEKLRQQKFDFDASKLKPYFELNSVLKDGVFYAANKLYGLTFEERPKLPTYHPDVRIFEVFDADGSSLGLLIADFFARPSKRGGAWMNSYVSQSYLLDNEPVIAMHLNIAEPPEGEPALLTFDEVNTMFHEFGHVLHGFFSDVRYPYFSGTSVPRDFVEFPSQVNEMWATWPSVLENYAVHYETGEPMPQELLDSVLAAQKFNQGYMTTEYLAAAILDQAWHQLEPGEVPGADQVLDFEASALEEAGVALDAVPPRYRSPYFSHIMGGYAAGYYAYIWSEVLDADTVEWFETHGGLSRETGQHFRETLLSKGGSVDAMKLFKDFSGREPYIEPLLERRGLVDEDSDQRTSE